MHARIDRRAGMIMQKRVAHRADLPVRHLALVHVGGVARGDRHAVAARDLQQLHGIVERAQHQRRAAERILRVGERHHKVHHDDAGFLAEADRGIAVAAPFVVVRHRVPSCCFDEGSRRGKRNPSIRHGRA